MEQGIEQEIEPKNENKEMITKKATRNSNLEILRILSMIMIVAHHYIVHSDIIILQATTINKLIIGFLELGGKLGVNIFVLITGYFLIEKQYKAEKAVKLFIKVFVYSVICLIIGIYNKSELLTFSTKISSFMPIINENYWFMTTYILLYLLQPYINKLFFALDKKQVEKLLITLFIMWSVIPTVFIANFGLNNLGWFIFIYLLGGYLRIYGNKFLENKKINIIAIITITIILTVLPAILAKWGKEYEDNGSSMSISYKLYFLAKSNDKFYFNSLNSSFIVILAISYFSLFKNRRPIINKTINTMSKHVLGIYLFHDNTFVKEVIWDKIVHCNWYVNSNMFIVNAICAIPIIFVGCLLLDIVIEFIFERNIYKIIEKKFLNKPKEQNV